LKQNFADQLQAQSEIWKAQVQGLSGGRSNRRARQARGEYKKSMEQMQDKARGSKETFAERKSVGANEEAWKDMVGGQPEGLSSNFGKRLGPTQFSRFQ